MYSTCNNERRIASSIVCIVFVFSSLFYSFVNSVCLS